VDEPPFLCKKHGGGDFVFAEGRITPPMVEEFARDLNGGLVDGLRLFVRSLQSLTVDPCKMKELRRIVAELTEDST